MNIIHKVKWRVQKIQELLIVPYTIRNKPKIFCIGANKTGTTSLKNAFIDLGFIVGNQRQAELLFNEYKRGDFNAIIKYCKTAQVFQDFPFSYPNTFKYLDSEYPNVKFILSVRETSEVWYNSLVKFHSKRFGEGKTPTSEQLKNSEYVWRGYIWERNQLLYKTPESDPYKKELLIKSYEDYNLSVIEYFKNRPQDLLVINIAEKSSYKRLIEFLEITSPFDDFPWKNKTSEITVK